MTKIVSYKEKFMKNEKSLDLIVEYQTFLLAD
jgi:hypothetical protein